MTIFFILLLINLFFAYGLHSNKPLMAAIPSALWAFAVPNPPQWPFMHWVGLLGLLVGTIYTCYAAYRQATLPERT